MRKRRREPTLRAFAPRRAPRQRRSLILFDKILLTARTLFEREGYRYVTTNRIAEAANISIGSLYQYFSNRESIALAVYESACAKAALAMKRRTLESLGLSLEASIPVNIAHLFDIFERDRYALLQLIEEAPELGNTSLPFSFANLIGHTAQAALQQRFSEASSTAIARKVYVMNACVVGFISRYLNERPEMLSKTAAIAEISCLVQRYIEALYSDHSADASPSP